MVTNQQLFRARSEGVTRPISGVASFGFALAIACAVAAVLSGIGYRLGFWHFRTGFDILRWAAYAAIAAALICLLGIILARPSGPRRGFGLSLVGLLIALVTFAVPAYELNTVKTVPFIHDITTDTENPPKFVAVLPLRQNVENSVEYAGPELAAKQKQGYPELGPAMLKAPPDKAFQQAAAVARSMGWEIVAEVPGEGRIEATDTTMLYGFTDDIVIRITPEGEGSRVDMRSVSRVGKSDVGVNAKRIRAFLAKLTASG